MYFELWGLETRNLLYDFDTLNEAIEAARELIDLNPGWYPKNLILGQLDENHKATWVARDDALLDLLKQRPAV